MNMHIPELFTFLGVFISTRELFYFYLDNEAHILAVKNIIQRSLLKSFTAEYFGLSLRESFQAARKFQQFNLST